MSILQNERHDLAGRSCQRRLSRPLLFASRLSRSNHYLSIICNLPVASSCNQGGFTSAMASQCLAASAAPCIPQTWHITGKGAAAAARTARWTPCRRPRRCPAVRPAALFGFGKQEPSQPASTQQQPQAESGPLLVPFTPIQKTADYSLRRASRRGRMRAVPGCRDAPGCLMMLALLALLTPAVASKLHACSVQCVRGG